MNLSKTVRQHPLMTAVVAAATALVAHAAFKPSYTATSLFSNGTDFAKVNPYYTEQYNKIMNLPHPESAVGKATADGPAGIGGMPYDVITEVNLKKNCVGIAIDVSEDDVPKYASGRFNIYDNQPVMVCKGPSVVGKLLGQIAEAGRANFEPTYSVTEHDLINGENRVVLANSRDIDIFKSAMASSAKAVGRVGYDWNNFEPISVITKLDMKAGCVTFTEGTAGLVGGPEDERQVCQRPSLAAKLYAKITAES